MLPGDERAATPVVSTLLLVAISVIVVALVGNAIVTGVTPDRDPAALADYDVQVTNDTVTISHLGGESLPLADLRVYVRNATSTTSYDPTTGNLSDADDARFDPGETWARTHPLTVGDDGDLEALLVHLPSQTIVARQTASAAALATTPAPPTVSTTTTTTTASTTTDPPATTRPPTTPTEPSLQNSEVVDTSDTSGNDRRARYTVHYEIDDPDDRFDRVEVVFDHRQGGSETKTSMAEPTGSVGYVGPADSAKNNQDDYRITIYVYDEDGDVTDQTTYTDEADGDDP